MVGGTLGILALPFADYLSHDRVVGVLVDCGAAFAAAGLILTTWRRLPPWGFQAFLALGTLVVTVVMLVIRSTVYLGSDKGDLYALDVRNGKVRWTYHASAEPVKTSPAFAAGKAFFADYGGSVHAVDAQSGKKVWQTDTDGQAGGSGGFYSSPAIAADKLFIGRDDGAFFALDQSSGKVLWSKQTGKAIIGSPAVAKVKGTPLSVYIGNYAGTLYALEADGGKQRWTYDIGGAIPGTPTVVGTTVYTSSFKVQEAVGVSAKSGERVFRFAAPGYTPMISDGERLFLIGYESIRAFEPN